MSVVKTTTLVIASRHAAYKTASIYFVAFALCPPGAEEQRELHYLWVIEAARVHTAFAPLRHAPRQRRIDGLVLRAGNLPHRISSRRA